MGKRYSFPEPNCRSCEKFHSDGTVLCETRYCMGVKSKKGKRFKSSDPKYKPPRWCPKRIAPVCRIYGFVDENAHTTSRLRQSVYGPKKNAGMLALEHHYKPRLELRLGWTASEFYKAVQREPVVEVLSEELQYGEVIEIDNGLKSYFFYYYDWSTVVPLPFFNKSRTKQAT